GDLATFVGWSSHVLGAHVRVNGAPAAGGRALAPRRRQLSATSQPTAKASRAVISFWPPCRECFVCARDGPKGGPNTCACYVAARKRRRRATDYARCFMQIRLGYELKYTFMQPTPVILTLNVHHSRAADLIEPDLLHIEPAVPVRAYHDGFGNWCSRLVAPAGNV